MNSLARLFQMTSQAAPPVYTKPLVLTHSDISVIAWCHGLDLAMRNPSAPYQPLMNNSFILVTDSEQQLFDTHMCFLLVSFLQYTENDGEGMRERLHGDRMSEADRRIEHMEEGARTIPEMRDLPRRLRPLRWDFDAMFGHLDLLTLDEVVDEEPVDQTSERTDTAALVTVVIDMAEDANCPICMEDAGADGLVKPQCCDHAFHLSCLDEWVNGPAGNAALCPLCRKSICLAK
ncbi:hypothetical protein FB567DRAFT_634097 [Paraphoma chrysanthemicola]|uniref:RING-type domain-containing protein n=1 Tax=Paraphoma chrysanthemicola TaxID=798071 RepID=A0A8K0QTG0_9PLEO|nr:hypothetical protein FB567DRAFT_634097 [Paraphoma chrysanthemicola]